MTKVAGVAGVTGIGPTRVPEERAQRTDERRATTHNMGDHPLHPLHTPKGAPDGHLGVAGHTLQPATFKEALDTAASVCYTNGVMVEGTDAVAIWTDEGHQYTLDTVTFRLEEVESHVEPTTLRPYEENYR